MNKLKIFYRLLLYSVIVFPSIVFAQNQISKTVFAASGDAVKSGNYFVEWTIGEVITSIDTGTDKYAFHGFHIFWGDKTVKIQDIEELASKVTIYPNPASNKELFVQFIEWTGQAKLSIIDMQGKILYQQDIFSLSGEVQKLDLSFINEGNYLLSIQEVNKPPFVKKFSIIRP